MFDFEAGGTHLLNDDIVVVEVQSRIESRRDSLQWPRLSVNLLAQVTADTAVSQQVDFAEALRRKVSIGAAKPAAHSLCLAAQIGGS